MTAEELRARIRWLEELLRQLDRCLAKTPQPKETRH